MLVPHAGFEQLEFQEESLQYLWVECNERILRTNKYLKLEFWVFFTAECSQYASATELVCI